MAKSTSLQVKNKTGSALPANKLVYITGKDDVDLVPTVAIASNNSESKMPAVGMTREDIANGELGEVRVSGVVSGFDTKGHSPNSSVYAGKNGGILFDNPFSGTAQKIGLVVNEAAYPDGQIFLFPLDVTIKHASTHELDGNDEIDHEQLKGLDTDSHKIYSLVDGSRAFANPIGGQTPTQPSHLVTKQYVDGLGQVVSTTFNSAVDGYVSFFINDRHIAGDEDFFWDRDNNCLSIGNGGSSGISNKLYVKTNGNATQNSLKLEHTGSNFIVRPLSEGGTSTIIENTGAGSLLINPLGGNVGIGTTPSTFKLQVDGYIGPNVDNVYGLGSPALRWQSVAVGPGSIHIISNSAETGVGHDWLLGLKTDAGGTFHISRENNNYITINTNGNISMPQSSLFVQGNLGIRTDPDPVYELSIAASTIGTDVDLLASTGTGGGDASLRLTTNGNQSWRIRANRSTNSLDFGQSSDADMMVIDAATSNVGIGVFPTTRFFVAGGTAHFQTDTNTFPLQVSRLGETTQQVLNVGVDDTYAVSHIIQDEAAAGFQWRCQTLTSPTDRIMWLNSDTSSLRLGIGAQTTADYQIAMLRRDCSDVNHSTYLDIYPTGSPHGESGILIRSGSDANPWYIYRSTSGVGAGTLRWFYTGIGDVLQLTTAGNLGIGRAPVTNKLEVEGNASKTTATAWLANSDIRIKTDIKDIENATDVIKLLRPISFNYTEEYKKQHPSIKNHAYYNFIAQEYQKVFPNSVQDDGEGLLQLDTYNTIPFMVAAIKELVIKIESIEEELRRIKEK